MRALDSPQSDVGAPLPHVMANDYKLAFAYRLVEHEADWTDTTLADGDGRCAVICASPYQAMRLGPPNDEALRGHRLFPLGLKPYTAFEVVNSTWIAEMERANRVHCAHDAAHYKAQRHFVFTFHDSLLEIVARKLAVSTRSGSLARLVLEAFESD